MSYINFFTPSRVVARALAEHIELGLYAPGEHMPSMDEVAALHGVKKNVARSALALLAVDGILVQRPGDGYYVPVEPGTGPDEQTRLWSTALAAVLNSGLPTPEIARRMDVAPDTIKRRLRREVPLTRQFTDRIVSATVQYET